ncbi:hypothetical protein KDA00_02015 [Candidatus Saccharibacteria bacterium]|nr:hypothetical protein [Candidatus Saccharibacteria bacterium]
MEKLYLESRNILRATLVAVGLGATALLASGCGQTTPPSPEQVESDAQYFTLDDVIAANGEPVHCFMYGSQSEGTNASKSWFGFACDFEGNAIFPGETTNTTLG